MSSACGSQVLSRGKHAGLSYSECLANDPQYCSFVLGRAHQMGPSYHGFVDYLQSQAAQPESLGADTPASDAQVEADGGYRYGGAPVTDTAGKADDGYRYDGASGDDGETVVGFGKHRGLTFRQVLEQEPNYCQWFVREAAARDERGEPPKESFTALLNYIQGSAAGGTRPASDAQVEADGGYRYGGAPVSDRAGKADDGYRYDGAAGDDGETVVGFGKHRGLTFRQLLEQEPNYCQWVVREAAARDERGEPPKEAFAALIKYVQGSAAGGALATVTRPAQRYPRGSYGGRNASPAPRSPPEGSDLGSGMGDVADVPLASATVAFGTKYKDRTFGEVVTTDKDYSSYILNQVLNSPEPRGANMVAFALYVQYVMCRDAVRM
jgi:hypothetical protein